MLSDLKSRPAAVTKPAPSTHRAIGFVNYDSRSYQRRPCVILLQFFEGFGRATAQLVLQGLSRDKPATVLCNIPPHVTQANSHIQQCFMSTSAEYIVFVVADGANPDAAPRAPMLFRRNGMDLKSCDDYIDHQEDLNGDRLQSLYFPQFTQVGDAGTTWAIAVCRSATQLSRNIYLVKLQSPGSTSFFNFSFFSKSRRRLAAASVRFVSGTDLILTCAHKMAPSMSYPVRHFAIHCATTGAAFEKLYEVQLPADMSASTNNEAILGAYVYYDATPQEEIRCQRRDFATGSGGGGSGSSGSAANIPGNPNSVASLKRMSCIVVAYVLYDFPVRAEACGAQTTAEIVTRTVVRLFVFRPRGTYAGQDWYVDLYFTKRGVCAFQLSALGQLVVMSPGYKAYFVDVKYFDPDIGPAVSYVQYLDSCPCSNNNSNNRQHHHHQHADPHHNEDEDEASMMLNSPGGEYYFRSTISKDTHSSSGAGGDEGSGIDSGGRGGGGGGSGRSSTIVVHNIRHLVGQNNNNHNNNDDDADADGDGNTNDTADMGGGGGGGPSSFAGGGTFSTRSNNNNPSSSSSSSAPGVLGSLPSGDGTQGVVTQQGGPSHQRLQQENASDAFTTFLLEEACVVAGFDHCPECFRKPGCMTSKLPAIEVAADDGKYIIFFSITTRSALLYFDNRKPVWRAAQQCLARDFLRKRSRVSENDRNHDGEFAARGMLSVMDRIAMTMVTRTENTNNIASTVDRLNFMLEQDSEAAFRDLIPIFQAGATKLRDPISICMEWIIAAAYFRLGWRHNPPPRLAFDFAAYEGLIHPVTIPRTTAHVRGTTLPMRTSQLTGGGGTGSSGGGGGGGGGDRGGSAGGVGSPGFAVFVRPREEFVKCIERRIDDNLPGRDTLISAFREFGAYEEALLSKMFPVVLQKVRESLYPFQVEAKRAKKRGASSSRKNQVAELLLQQQQQQQQQGNASAKQETATTTTAAAAAGTTTINNRSAGATTSNSSRGGGGGSSYIKASVAGDIREVNELSFLLCRLTALDILGCHIDEKSPAFSTCIVFFAADNDVLPFAALCRAIWLKSISSQFFSNYSILLSPLSRFANKENGRLDLLAQDPEKRRRFFPSVNPSPAILKPFDNVMGGGGGGGGSSSSDSFVLVGGLSSAANSNNILLHQQVRMNRPPTQDAKSFLRNLRTSKR